MIISIGLVVDIILSYCKVISFDFLLHLINNLFITKFKYKPKINSNKKSPR